MPDTSANDGDPTTPEDGTNGAMNGSAADGTGSPPAAADGSGSSPTAADGTGSPPAAASGTGSPPAAASGTGSPPAAASGAETSPDLAKSAGNSPTAANGSGSPQGATGDTGASPAAADGAETSVDLAKGPETSPTAANDTGSAQDATDDTGGSSDGAETSVDLLKGSGTSPTAANGAETSPDLTKSPGTSPTAANEAGSSRGGTDGTGSSPTSGSSGASNNDDAVGLEAAAGPEDAADPRGVAAPASAVESGAADRDDATRPDMAPPVEPTAGSLVVADESPSAMTAVHALPEGEKSKNEKSKKPKKKRSRRAKWLRRSAYVLGVLILLPVAGFIVAYLMTPVPTSSQPLANAQPSTFYFSDGKSVILKKGTNRQPVPLSQVPKPVRDAVISAENRSFYSDPGVSVKGTARAFWATATGGSMQGGSTITQQMVRNYYSGLSQQRTASRKLKEIMIALKVGREKDKSWILQTYLNTIYFGRDAYGIEAAAKAYYNKDVQDLTPAEGAYIAAAIQVPSTATDTSNPKARAYMQSRWKYVVDGMVQMRSITPQQAATMRFPLPKKEKIKDVFAGEKGYMYDLAKAELLRLGYSQDQINYGGLKIRTTFDKDLMDDAKAAVEDAMPSSVSSKVMAGLVSVDPSTGEINAFYGGKQYLDNNFNTAFDAKVQPGSGFKPYVLAAALNDGMSLDDQVDGSDDQTFDGSKQPIQNDNHEDFGPVNLVTATQESINTAYVNIAQKIGNDKVMEMAEKLGIPESQLTANGANTAVTFPLGVIDVSVEQQAAAYAAFASEGVYHAPHVIRSVTDRNGKKRVVPTTGKRVFSTQIARDATYAMQKVVDAGTGTNAALPDRNAAGKTGTTSSGKQVWFNGFIPQLAASVGIFRSDNKALSLPGYSSYGGDLPATIWHNFLVKADADMPVKSFGDPSVYVGGRQYPTTPVQPQPHPSFSRPRTTRPSHPSSPTHHPPTGGPPTHLPTGGPTGQPTGRVYDGGDPNSMF
ncbi:transglycosylase domain-containing protein [Actinoallomurus sp. NPDC050550]|uniref:transglycosylase domain-containing protein n=1 Tax=Actinoallomurus sp. NPDC050550 TaxID=3154937 RepID=UPI00340B19E7